MGSYANKMMFKKIINNIIKVFHIIELSIYTGCTQMTFRKCWFAYKDVHEDNIFIEFIFYYVIVGVK